MSAARSACRSVGIVLLAGAAGLAVWPANGAVADEAATPPEARSLVATASAQGIRVSYTVPDLFVVSQFIDGGGPIAQATVDTTGRAIGFGSAPYPGENGVSAPGLLTFATGAPVPPYPFYARADHPVQPTSEVKDPSGSYVLSAAAEAGKAVGRAAFTGGPADKPVSQSTSDASGVLDPSGAKVTAVSVNQGLSFGDGALRIASVTSRSVSTYTAGDAKPKTEAALTIEGARVGDQPVTIGPDGVHPGGQTVPVPFGEGATLLNEALAKSGISVKTISTESPEGGVTTDALEVTLKHPIPGAENTQGTFVYTIGGSSSFIAFGAEGPGLPPLPEPIPESAGVEAPPAASAPNADAAVPDVTSAASSFAGASGATFSSALGSGSPSASGSSDSGAASTAADTATGAIGQAAAAPLGTEVAPVVLARDFRGTTKLLFVLLGVGAALLLASSSLWRAKGVLAAWKG